MLVIENKLLYHMYIVITKALCYIPHEIGETIASFPFMHLLSLLNTHIDKYAQNAALLLIQLYYTGKNST